MGARGLAERARAAASRAAEGLPLRCVGGVLTAGALSHLLGDPVTARADVAALLGVRSGPGAGLAIGAATLLEGWIGLRLLILRRGLLPAAAALIGAYTLLLGLRGATDGWGVRCGCLSAFVGAGAGAGVARNLVLLALLAWSARRAREPGGRRSVRRFGGRAPQPSHSRSAGNVRVGIAAATLGCLALAALLAHLGLARGPDDRAPGAAAPPPVGEAVAPERLRARAEAARDDPERPAPPSGDPATTPATGTVRGVVRARGGPRVAAARIRVRTHDGEADETTADALGSFALRAAAGEIRLQASAPGHGDSAEYAAHLEPGGAVDVAVSLPPRPGTLQGTVTGPDGACAAGAAVRAGEAAEDRWDPIAPHVRVRAAGAREVRTSADGRFRFDDQPAGPVTVTVAALGAAPWTGTVQVPPGETVELAVRLDAGVRVHGKVTCEDGRSPAGLMVRAEQLGGARSVAAAADGTFEIRRLADGPLRVWIDAGPRGRAETRLVLGPGEERRWDPVVSRGLRLFGRVVDERGGPLAGWGVRIGVPRERLDMAAAVATDAEGRFEFPGRDDGASTVLVSGRLGRLPAFAVEGVRAGPTPLEIVVPDSAMPVLRPSGRVVDASGRPVVGAQVALATPDRMSLDVARSGEDGRFEFGPVPSGRFRLLVWVAGAGQADCGEREVAGTAELGDVAFPELVAFELRFGPPALLAARTGTVRVMREGASETAPAVFEGPVAAVVDGRLFPGRHRIRWEGRGILSGERTLEVGRAESLPVEIGLEEAPPVELEFRAEDPERRIRTVVATIRDAAGSWVFDAPVAPNPEGRLLCVPFLVPGRYRVLAVANTGAAFDGEIRVPGGTRSDPLQVELR